MAPELPCRLDGQLAAEIQTSLHRHLKDYRFRIALRRLVTFPVFNCRDVSQSDLLILLKGALTVRTVDVLSAMGSTCQNEPSANGSALATVTSYEAVLQGSGQAPTTTSCNSDLRYTDLLPASYTVSIAAPTPTGLSTVTC